MREITLENGKKIKISEDSYKSFEDAISTKVKVGDIIKKLKGHSKGRYYKVASCSNNQLFLETHNKECTLIINKKDICLFEKVEFPVKFTHGLRTFEVNIKGDLVLVRLNPTAADNITFDESLTSLYKAVDLSRWLRNTT